MHLSRAIVPAVITQVTEHEEELEARQIGGFTLKEGRVQTVRVRIGLDTGFMAYTVLYTQETPFNSTEVTYLSL